MSGAGPLDAVDGPLGLPRSNGELVFDAPWQSRVFGLTMALHDRGLFDWESFRHELIVQTAHADAETPDARAEADFYARWLVALERLLERLDVVGPEDIQRHARDLAAHEHDHSPAAPPSA